MRNFIYILFSALILTSSCVKDLADLNVNPNDQTSTNPENLFIYSLKQGVSNYNSDVTLEQWSIMNWNMYLATRGGVEPGKEYIMPSGKDAFWTEQYTQGLANIQQLINNIGNDATAKNKIAAARIWKVFLFHRLTDLWGNIPYSNALGGMNNLNFTPEYDNQKDIYYDMLKELKEAANQFDASLPFFSSNSDLIYNGDINKWKVFANSLRLRLAIRIKYADNAKYQTEINELKNADLITNNSFSALFPYNQFKKNDLYGAYFIAQAVEQNNPSKFLVDLLLNSNDPRKSVYLRTSPLSQSLPWFDKYKGVPNLVPNNSTIWDSFDPYDDGSWGDISPIGSWFLRNNTPGVLISYSEVCFLKAEAALDGYWPGNAQSFYEEGVRADMDFKVTYGDTSTHISNTEIDNYINNLQPVSLEEIITQKWILFAFENGYEAYSEYRRTGFPVLKNYDGSPINNSNLPVRLSYPTSEYSYNGQNVANAIANQGADNGSTKIWWDKN
jgi:hypothetical protein